MKSVIIALLSALVANAQIASLKIKEAKGSSTLEKYAAALAVDGKISDQSRWVSDKEDYKPYLDIVLDGVHELSGIHLHTGFGNKDALRHFRIQFRANGEWKDIPSAVFANNSATALAIAFDATVVVKTDQLRIAADPSNADIMRIKEVIIFPSGKGDFPKIQGGNVAQDLPQVPLIYLNQSGFNTGRPKRFTVPTVADGESFQVKNLANNRVVFEGKVSGGGGDFSSLNPEGEDEYVVECDGHRSVPFRIGQNWLERVTYQNAVNFMIDSRHLVGNYRKPCRGSFGWRDDHHFGWELHTLVPQYLSNPSAYDRMPRQVKYEKSSDGKSWGKLEPYADDAPDIVKLIHWGADVIVTQGLKHELIKSQLAYFLHAWPVLSTWLPEQNYRVVQEYVFAVWKESGKDQNYPYDESKDHNLLALKTHIGSTKGAFPPGFSVQPNILMYEVALREKRADAPAYLDAAVKQVSWMIAHADWNDPLVTKGQRMSEFVTMTGMAHLLESYPDQAPRELRKKINDWGKVIIRRSANMWDFRKLDDKNQWTPMGEKPQMWNEPGNVLGLPASIFSALPFIDSDSERKRLEQIAFACFDNMFGRNPAGLHFCFDAPREIEGVEKGWYSQYKGGIGQLANARFVIDGSCKNGHYPYNPQVGNIGWTEGWIQFNTPFNLSLCYLAKSDTSVEIMEEQGKAVIRLKAPLNFDYKKAETAEVVLESVGKTVKLALVEESANSAWFRGSIAKPKGTLTASYGYGWFKRSATLP